MNTGNGYQNTILQDVLYIPDLNGNLLSVSHFMHCGSEIRFTSEGCQFLDQHKNTTCISHLRGNLYIMDIKVTTIESTQLATLPNFPSEGEEAPALALTACAKPSSTNLQTWHHWLGHLNPEVVSHMLSKNMVTGMEITDGSTIATLYELCVKGKQSHANIHKSTDSHFDTILGCIFSDVCSQLPIKSHDRYEYFITWVEDKSQKVFVAGMQEKSEVTHHLKAFISRAEVETGQCVGILCSDRGGKYIAGEVQCYLEDRGIKHEMTTLNTPQHNGVAEHMNQTLLDKVQAMLIDTDLPQSYWYDTLHYAMHIHNVTPTQALDNITPEEAWSRNKPDVSNIRTFSVHAFVQIPDSHHDKLSAHSLICIFIGLTCQCKAYCLVHRQTCQFIELHNVIFDEGGALPHYECMITEDNDMTGGVSVNETPSNALQQSPALTAITSCPKCNTRAPVKDDDTRYSVTSYGPHSHTTKHASVAHANVSKDPKTYMEAMARFNATEWEMACNDEKCSFDMMGIYEVVPCPKVRKVVSSKWVFCIKQGPDGTIQKYKACIVVQGFIQVEGIDYDETFAPIAKLSSLRAILTITVELNLKVHQMDVKSIYLNGELEEEIFMEPPPGFDVPEGMVLKLIKAIYGTKQGGHVWYNNVKATLEGMGYMCTESDHAVFICLQDGKLSIIALYVDNFTMACKDLEIILHDKEELKKHYSMMDLGEISYILGMLITWDHKAGRIDLSQQKYIEEILQCFGKTDVHPISTPALMNKHLTKLTSPETNIKSYQRALGAIMYPMLGTCLDLTYAIGALGRHAANPGEEHE